MRVIFFGNGFDYSLSFLRVLVEHPDVSLVAMVSPARGGQRRHWGAMATTLAARLPEKIADGIAGDRIRFPVTALRLTQAVGAKIFWPCTVNDPGLIDELSLLFPDLIVMAGFNEILQPSLLRELSPVINVHPSLLPEFRGAHPEFWTIAQGATESGVSIHRVDAGIDTGDLVAQAPFPVEPWLTGGALQKRAMAIGGRLLADLLTDFDPQHTPRWPQSGEGSYFPRLAAEHVLVPFELPAQAVYDRARAAAPWLPLIVYVPHDWWSSPMHFRASTAASRWPAAAMVRLQLHGALPFPDESGGTPGTVRRTEDGGLTVACSPGVVYFSHVV